MTTATPTAMQRLMRMSLISQIAIGLLLGIALALLAPGATPSVALLGDLFISALKAVAPVLVFVLVMAAIANHKHGQPTHIRPVLTLYLLGTLAAALVAVLASLTFPTTLVLDAPKISGTPPGGIIGVLKNLLLSAFSNPVKALMEANFIGILAWAVMLGVALRHASQTTRTLLNDVSNAVSAIVHVVIRFAPVGIFGLVAATLGDSGLEALLGYAHLLLVIVGIMIYLALRFEWRFAVSAIIANLHDVIIILGFFAFFQWEFSLSVLAAVLAAVANDSRDLVWRDEAMGKVMTQRYGVPYQVVAHDAIFRVLLGPVAADQQASLLEQIRQGGLEQAFIVP